jgi:hypothetical protein
LPVIGAVLDEAIKATLPHRCFRDEKARLFADSGADALRTAIAKACKAAAVPLWSPHDLRHRRISLLHLRGAPWARIAEFVGQRKLSGPPTPIRTCSSTRPRSTTPPSSTAAERPGVTGVYAW